jgi:hypothetical protein
MVGWLVVSTGTARGARWGGVGSLAKTHSIQQRTSLESKKKKEERRKNQNKAVIKRKRVLTKNMIYRFN